MPFYVKLLSATGTRRPCNGCFCILYSKVLSIKNYGYKLLNAWILFLLCTAKIHILSHITIKKLLAFSGFAHLLMLSTSCKHSSV